ncbi:MAG: hypothetical protein P1P84_12865 [Deferrisomatales bacterium]|nr:hypothetical protein [Deferrisomatales bacterium]
MARERGTALLVAAVVACLGWAAVEAGHVDWSRLGDPPSVVPPVERRRVEESFAAIRADLGADRTEAAVLALRRRTEHGPYAGTAWFLLGEVAAAQGAYVAAVRHYRRAVEQDPVVADRNGPFGSGDVIEARLTALLDGVWATERPPEVRDLYYLRRRLGGGCE